MKIVILSLIFAAGVLHWVLFLNHGDLSFRLEDWGKEFIFYSVVRQAINSGTVPYHISVRFYETDRFLGIPETNLAPHVLLLPLMSTGGFVLFDLLLLYALGFLGLLFLARRYNLSLIAFAAFFLLFNFNGHITAHIGVGHSAWTGYFLLPWLFLFMMEVIEGHATRMTPLKLALVLFAMVLKGSFHLYIWCLILLALVVAFNWRQTRPILWGIVASLALSLFRLVPAAFTLLGRREKFIWSYPTINDLVDAMVTIRQQTPDRLKLWGTAGWWEYDMYVGIIGFALLVYFGIWLRFSRRDDLKPYKYPALDLPLVVMLLLALSYFQGFITRIPFPPLRIERVATRFVLVPVATLSLISVIRLEQVLRGIAKTLRVRFLEIAALALMALSFVDHSFLWSVPHLEQVFKDKLKDTLTPSITSRPDGGYEAIVIVSAVASLVALGAVVYLAVNARRGQRSISKS
ncbi:MAG TPA: hypothetical protein VMU02_11990 [bacterium]|nr:hypothetical protein [bacterium]